MPVETAYLKAMLTWGGPSDGTAKGEVMCQSKCGTLEDLRSHLFERNLKQEKGKFGIYMCVAVYDSAQY